MYSVITFFIITMATQGYANIQTKSSKTVLYIKSKTRTRSSAFSKLHIFTCHSFCHVKQLKRIFSKLIYLSLFIFIIHLLNGIRRQINYWLKGL